MVWFSNGWDHSYAIVSWQLNVLTFKKSGFQMFSDFEWSDFKSSLYVQNLKSVLQNPVFECFRILNSWITKDGGITIVLPECNFWWRQNVRRQCRLRRQKRFWWRHRLSSRPEDDFERMLDGTPKKLSPLVIFLLFFNLSYTRE